MTVPAGAHSGHSTSHTAVVRKVRPRAPYDGSFLVARLAAWSANASDLELRTTDDQAPAIRLALAVPSGAVVVDVTVPGAGTGRAIDSAGDSAGGSAGGSADAADDRWSELRIEVVRDDGTVSDADADAASATLRSAWGLDDDLSGLEEAALGDPPFHSIAKRFRGARVIRHLSPAEALAWALIRQRTPHGFARDSLHRLRDALGPRVEAYGRTWTAFPTVDTLASDDARAGLLAATRNTRKVDRLHAASATLAELDPDTLRSAPVDDVRRQIGRGHGVGSWTVDYVALMGLGRFEQVPWSDTGLAQAIADTYAGGLTLDRGTLRTLASRYEGVGGVWAHWLKRARHGWGGY